MNAKEKNICIFLFYVTMLYIIMGNPGIESKTTQNWIKINWIYYKHRMNAAVCDLYGKNYFWWNGPNMCIW